MRDAMRFSRLVFAVSLTLLSGTLAAAEAGPGQPGPGRPVPQTPFTATLWTPPLFGERFDCSVVNVSSAPVTVKIEIVNNQGFVDEEDTSTIAPDTVAVITVPSGAALRYCRISLTGNPDDVRGALQARDNTGGTGSAVHAR